MVVGTREYGFGGDPDGGPGGGSYWGGGGDGRDGEYDGWLVKQGGYCSKHNLMDRS